MYRLKEIQEALLSVVGWEQSYDPTMAIEPHLTNTDSGLYFQGAHPLLTINNLSAVMPDSWDAKYSRWNQILSYKVGDKVSYNDMIWIAIADSMGEEPNVQGDFNNDFNADYSLSDYGNAYWKPFNSVSDWLERFTSQGIAQVVQNFIQMKGLEKETRNLLERRTFFDGAGRLKATIDNKDKLVGFEINPVRSMGVTTKIEKVGLQMVGATGNVRLYLFHSSQDYPIKTWDLNFTGGFQWFTLDDCYMPYISDSTNSGGSWFLCYNQSELPFGMEAVNMSKDWSREPCGSCNKGDINVWREMTKYLQVTPFANNAPSDFTESPSLFDIETMMYTNTTNYGLNCEITVGCDVSDFIISQKDLFATVIQKQVASTALRTIAMNPDNRVNRSQVNASRTDILYELDGNTNGLRPNGLGQELKEAYKALRLDTQGIDRICLGCNNKGVRYKSI